MDLEPIVESDPRVRAPAVFHPLRKWFVGGGVALVALALTLTLYAFLVAVGVSRLVLAYQMHGHPGWGWTLVSGILSVLLGGVLLLGWPLTATLAIGLDVGVDLLVAGGSLLGLVIAGPRDLSHGTVREVGCAAPPSTSGLVAQKFLDDGPGTLLMASPHTSTPCLRAGTGVAPAGRDPRSAGRHRGGRGGANSGPLQELSGAPALR